MNEAEVAMSDNMNTSTSEATAEKMKHNGSKPKRNGGDPVPGVNLRELYAERNWTALTGLGLVGLGILLVLQDILNLNLSLWSLALGGVGVWLMADAWKKYQAANRTWTDNAQPRMLIGAGAVLVALLNIIHLPWTSLFLIGIGGWLAYDTWQRHQALGQVWTPQNRNRMFVAAAMGLIGLFGFLHLGGAWPLLMIVGVVMILRHNRGARCC
jgi:hypothetical protein